MMQSPSWEANWFAASQEIPRISRNPKVHYRTHKRPPSISILGPPSPIHILASHLLEIHHNIMHPSTPRPPSPVVSFPRFPHQESSLHWLIPYPIAFSPYRYHHPPPPALERHAHWVQRFFHFSFCTLSLPFLLRVVSPFSLALFLTNLFPFCFLHVSLFPWPTVLYNPRTSPPVPHHVGFLRAPFSPNFKLAEHFIVLNSFLR